MKDLERENFLKHIPVGEYRINLFVLMRHDILNVSVSHVGEDICDSLRSNNTLIWPEADLKILIGKFWK